MKTWLWKILGADDEIRWLRVDRDYWKYQAKHHEKQVEKLRGGPEPLVGATEQPIIQHKCSHVVDDTAPWMHRLRLGPNHTVDVCQECYDGIVGKVLRGLKRNVQVSDPKGE